VAEAGVPGAITIATNMAGPRHRHQAGVRSICGSCTRLPGSPTKAEKAAKIERIKADVERFRDIVLKAEDVIEVEPQRDRSRPDRDPAGRLYIIGSERHESRRIDNQLRGRSGRQGDPAVEILSVAGDDLMRIFGSTGSTPC